MNGKGISLFAIWFFGGRYSQTWELIFPILCNFKSCLLIQIAIIRSSWVDSPCLNSTFFNSSIHAAIVTIEYFWLAKSVKYLRDRNIFLLSQYGPWYLVVSLANPCAFLHRKTSTRNMQPAVPIAESIKKDKYLNVFFFLLISHQSELPDQQ